MRKLKQVIKKPITIIAVILIVTVFVIIKKIEYYSADPVGEKNCPPLFPDFVGDPSKQNTIEIDIPQYDFLWAQKGGFINDASCLNKTAVYGVVSIQNTDDIKNALIFAKNKDLKISIAGVKHSMGGHAFYKNALILDMTKFNQMTLNEEDKILNVQSGATWHDIQNFLHPKLAVKAMQSTDIFTIGGSISVNAHGMDHQAGAIARTIRSMRIMLPDGSIKTVSHIDNPELFNLVIGGYGLFGIVLDVNLEITENVVYQSERKVIDYKDFLDVFGNEIENDKNIGLFYGHLSTAPQSFLKEMILYSYKKVDAPDAKIPPLEEVGSIKLRRFIFNLAKQGSIPMRLKWFAEKYIEPMLENCPVSRNQALSEGEACLVSRNEPMHDSVPYLRNNLKNDTDILHEYFIPRDQFVPYIDEMRTIMTEADVNLLNASVRVVHKENNFLNYSPTDTFSIVLYINQKTDESGNQKMRKVTQELIDLTIKHGGRFFLPYQLHYTTGQLERAYPEFKSFLTMKKKYDPQELFTSTFYKKYSAEP
ncbi:MAG TPA: FAD-binding oxidoreductase [Candidatus Paceibacterota bacterium]